MPISSLTYDYTGRKKDISILQNASPTIVDTQQIDLKFGKITKFCAGIQKAIQQYAVILLTDLKSQTNFPEFGTSLIFNLSSGTTPIDRISLSQLFGLANHYAINTLKNHYATAQVPKDEQIATASLTDISIHGSTVSFRILITTALGEEVNFLIPLPE